MDLLIDLYLHGKITEARNKAEQARDSAKHLRHEVDDLKRKADALTITCQALWEILRSRLNINDQTIIQKMQEIDLRDGKLDGRIATKTAKCSRCSRLSNSKRAVLSLLRSSPPGWASV